MKKVTCRKGETVSEVVIRLRDISFLHMFATEVDGDIRYEYLMTLKNGREYAINRLDYESLKSKVCGSWSFLWLMF